MGLMLKGLHWGYPRGKVSITGEAAKEEFGFTTKVGATGIMFRRYHYVTSTGKRKVGIFINNYVPKVDSHTVAQQANRIRFGILSNAANENLETLKPIWQPLATRHRPKTGMWCNEFRGVNMDRIGAIPDWTKLLISNGRLEPTQEITSVTFNPITLELTINFDNATYQNGDAMDESYGAMFDYYTSRLFVATPTQVWRRRDGQFKGTISEAITPSHFVAFTWFYRDPDYSESTPFYT
jgi:hypothetical protein